MNYSYYFDVHCMYRYITVHFSCQFCKRELQFTFTLFYLHQFRKLTKTISTIKWKKEQKKKNETNHKIKVNLQKVTNLECIYKYSNEKAFTERAQNAK